ncbi:MAG: PaaI family thioesterase [Chitinophagales bacterium]
MQQKSIQDYMVGNVCFGCGKDNHDGLQIDSYWQENDEIVCVWHSQTKYQGWKGILNGGILASLIDCHCMGAAMAAVYKAENRNLDSQPVYRYATGTISIRYMRPTPNDKSIELRAKVLEIKGKKVTIHCDVWVERKKTAEANVIAIKVFDSSQESDSPFAE